MVIRTSVPTQFTAGESFSFSKSFADYSASEYTLTYYFRSKTGKGFNKVATANGTAFEINVLPSDTDKMTAGQCSFQAFVTRTDKKLLVDSGDCLVMPSLSKLSADSTHDNRSVVKRTLDAIDAVLEQKATNDQLSYQIGGRSLQRYSIADLLELRKTYARLFAEEERNKNGGGIFKVRKFRFGVTS